MGICPRGGQIDGLREWQEIIHVTVDQIHLFGQIVVSKRLVELEKASRLEGPARLVKSVLPLLQGPPFRPFPPCVRTLAVARVFFLAPVLPH